MSKRAEERARKAFPGQQPFIHDRCVFRFGYEQAEKDLGWHSVDECLPEIDEEVIVLADRLNLGSLYAIAVAHIVDKEKAVDYNGWNVPGVKFWMPMPKIPEIK